MVLSMFSMAAQFNVDIRDCGYFNRPGTTIADGDWKDMSTVTAVRIKNKLKPYTLQMIAALNYQNCGNYALGAWVRAYGMGFGIYPAMGSKFVNESEFKENVAPFSARQAVTTYETTFDDDSTLMTLCANILSVFGLFHLHKDLTFRRGDTKMNRIGKSFINMLRAGTSKATVKSMLVNMEIIVRIAPHPFGLAQTYWLALAMHRYGYLYNTLAVRIHHISPPPVRRLMILVAAVKEWNGMQVLCSQLSDLWAAPIQTIQAQVEAVKANAPAYSELHELYDIQQQVVLTSEVRSEISIMMPIVKGYAIVTHFNDRNEKNGIGLFVALKNIEGGEKTLVRFWRRSWEKILKGSDLNCSQQRA